MKYKHNNFEYEITDELIINYENYHDASHAYLLHDAGFPICIVFADNEQEALDTAVNENKLDDYLIEDNDIDSLSIITLPHPGKLSYCKTIEQ